MKYEGYIQEMVTIELDKNNPELKTEIGDINTKQIKYKLVDLLKKNRSNYATKSTDIGTIPGVEFKINLTSDKPICKQPYPS